MADTGLIVCGTGANGDSGDSNWSNPTYIQVDDSSNASVSLGKDEVSAYLRATNFNFGSISGYYLLGIQVEINVVSVGSDFNMEDILLRTSAGRTGNDKGSSSPSTGIRTFGGSTDLWGTAYTMSNIVNSTFGIDYRCGRAGASGSSGSVSIDYVKIRIYYRYKHKVNSVTSVGKVDTVLVGNIKTINGR